MTDHALTRCEICDWPLAESRKKGCVPGDCSYRPDEPREQERIRLRRKAIAEGRPTPSERPVAHNVGGFVADYSRLTPEEIAQSEPELDELYVHSVPAERPVAQVREDIARVIDPDSFEDAYLQDDLTPTERMHFSGEWSRRRVEAERKADKIRAITSERPSEVLTGADAWDDLIYKDDRTSPEEYPDMALITREELIGYMERACGERPSEAAVAWRIAVPGGYAGDIFDNEDDAKEEVGRWWRGQIEPLYSIPHGDAVRAQTIEECAKVLEALYNAKLPEGTYSSDVYEGLAVAIDSIRALSRVQATNVASATACDHLTTEKAEIERLRYALEECCHMAGAYTSEADAIDWLNSIATYSVKALEGGQVIANQENLHGSEPEPTLASERVSERTGDKQI